ncbi:MAG: hypothetical protein ACN4E2_03840 [Nitrospinota bacterium]
MKLLEVSIATSDSVQGRRPAASNLIYTYLGPSDIKFVKSIDIYKDADNRISAVKIVRKTIIGEKITTLFTDVKQLSIKELPPKDKRIHGIVTISVRNASKLSFP